METELLRRWEILGDLKDEELDNIAYVVMYGNPLVGVESAVFIVKDSDEVFGLGSNNLLASKFKWPMIESFPLSGGKVKIDRLCGLELEKIVIGSRVVGGLAKSGMAYAWYFSVEELKEEAVIMFEHYTGAVRCQIPNCACRGSLPYSSVAVGGKKLSICNNLFRTYTATSPPPFGTRVSKFINSDIAQTICSKCSRWCTSAKLGDHNLEYCINCETYPEYWVDTPGVSFADEVKLLEHEGVVDIACGEDFVTFLTRSNDLVVHGEIMSISFCSSVCNPDQIIIKAVACGSNHLAAISCHGELYTCGWGARGQLGYSLDDVDLTLRRVSLEGIVVKVCCGLSATVCLMLDGSVYCFGSSMKLSGKGSLLVNQLETAFITQPTKISFGEKFTDITYVPLTNEFHAKTKSGVHSWGHKTSNFPFPEKLPGVKSLLEAVINQPIAASCGGFLSQKNTHIPSPVEIGFACLYGKKHLSDFVLKLSDGDFPVHSLVLFIKSAYFRDNVLKNEESPLKELDVASYNPVAYKALLKYFYQLPPDDLESSDLVDLHLLATSYKETDVIFYSYYRLKEMIGFDTVKPIRAKAVAADCKDLLLLCDAFMRTPEFQAKLLDFISQMPEHSLSFLS